MRKGIVRQGDTTTHGGKVLEGMHRDGIGMYLWVSPREKALIRDELERRVAESSKYSLFGNSCSSNVADVLELAGILAHDPRGFDLVSPADVLVGLRKSNRLVEERHYKKGYGGGASGNW